jgi:STE24 endopeptidase
MQDHALNPSDTLTLIFALALTGSLLLKLWLATRQIRHVATHRDAMPPAFASTITLPAHQRAADYTVVKTRFGLIELAWGAALTLAWTLLGGLSALNNALLEAMGAGLWQQLALVGAFTAINALLELPFSLYATFVIEERFGFNKTSGKLWLQDLMKSLLLSVLIGGPLLALVLWLMAAAGQAWWAWTWGVWMGFNLLAMLIYPTWIAPLFNKFKVLDDATLTERVRALMQRCGFQAKGFYVMDGSKRSAHANAYFTGFGASKRVVFYDTLLARLTPDEVDAVLAHELGHFKHKHILKRIVSIFAISLAGFALLGWANAQVWFYTGLGVMPNLDGANDALALLLFMLALPSFTGFLGPLFSQISRKHEFEADAYAMAQTRGSDLASALLKLYEDNASTLTPDPLYVKFYYSHPPASERLGRMLAAP